MILSLFTNLLVSIGFAKVSFESDFDFLSFTIKDTYAGYRDKVKGNEFDLLVKRVKQSHSKDTFALLSQMTYFFNEQHLLLSDYNIAKVKVDTVNCKKDSANISSYLKGSSKLKDPYEGFWVNDFKNCIIGLKKVKSNPVSYYGYVIQTKLKAIPGRLILKLIQQKDGTYLTDYIDEGLNFRIFVRSKFKNINTLWVNSYGIWHRVNNYNDSMLLSMTPFSYKTTFVNAGNETVVLKMPDFSSYNIKRIDSIVKANTEIIKSAKTLILDIRNNTGGTARNYLPLLPFIYTGPIIHCGGYELCSEDAIKSHENSLLNAIKKGDTARIEKLKEKTELAKHNRGKFIYIPTDTLANGLQILLRPKNIAILVNNSCLSAAELMLLDFKQSAKTTIFGERTGGAVDYLDALEMDLPVSKYNLFIATVKRALTDKEPSYDKTGILPDIEINDNVLDWISFVKSYYNERK